MALEEIRKNPKIFEDTSLKLVEAAIKDWVNYYCEDNDPDFENINCKTIKEALLEDEDLIDEIADYVALLAYVKMVKG